MTTIKKSVLILIFTLFIFGGCRIDGKVAAPNGVGIENIQLMLEGPQNLSTVTDEWGRYSFIGLPPGAYQLTAVSDWCELQAPLVAANLGEVPQKIDFQITDMRLQTLDPACRSNLSAVRDVIDRMRGGDALRVVCFGDSLTFGYTAFVPPYLPGWQLRNPYPQLLSAELSRRFPEAEIEVLNLGNCGEATGGSEGYLPKGTSGRERVQDVVKLQPDLVLMMYGYNDRRIGLPVAQSIENWRFMVETILASGAAVVAMSGPPELEDDNATLLPYYEIPWLMHKEYGVAYINLHSEMVSRFSYDVLSGILPDNVHYNDYTGVADIIMGHF